MKRKFVKVVFVAAIAMVSGINVFNAQKVVDLSDIALINIEALADDEYSQSIWERYEYTLDNGTTAFNCWKGGSSTC